MQHDDGALFLLPGDRLLASAAGSTCGINPDHYRMRIVFFALAGMGASSTNSVAVMPVIKVESSNGL
jgi:hypothetical protein